MYSPASGSVRLKLPAGSEEATYGVALAGSLSSTHAPEIPAPFSSTTRPEMATCAGRLAHSSSHIKSGRALCAMNDISLIAAALAYSQSRIHRRIGQPAGPPMIIRVHTAERI